MKLKNRLFLAFFLFAFLPVAGVSLLSLELSIRGMEQVTSRGIEDAMNDARALVELTWGQIERHCLAQLGRIPLRAPTGDLQDQGFDAVLIRSDADTELVVNPALRSPLLREALLDRLPAAPGTASGRLVLPQGLLIYATDAGEDVSRLAGVLLPEVQPQLLDAFGTHLQRFDQLRLLEATGRRFLRLVWAAGNVLYLLVILLVTRLAARGLTRPLARLGEMVETVGAGNWDVHLDYRRSDEIGTLVTGFNRMSVRLAETTERMLAAERAAAWQQTARAIAHGIKNALAPVKLATARLRQRVDTRDPALDSAAGTIQSELERLERMAKDFSTYGRPIEGRPSPLNLNPVIRQASELCDPAATLVLAEELPRIYADRHMLREALGNLIKNAREAAGPEGTVKIESGATEERVIVRVMDNGPGIDPEIAPRLFEPYATTKARGTGLGLAIARKIIVSSGGDIDVETGGEGTTFRVSFARTGKEMDDVGTDGYSDRR